jgi:hypothetical protein
MLGFMLLLLVEPFRIMPGFMLLLLVEVPVSTPRSFAETEA